MHEAHDGQERLRLACEFKPEVVLLDLGMPGISAFEVACEFRGRAAQPAPRIIAVTGWGQESDRRLKRKTGFDFHLPKPVNHTELDVLLSMDVRGPARRLRFGIRSGCVPTFIRHAGRVIRKR